MMPFRATAAGYEAHWEEAERHVLATVAHEVADLLREQAGLPDVEPTDPLDALAIVQSTGTPRVPDDPAVQRLLPAASRDDDAVAAEFRHLTQTDLAAAKVRGLDRFADIVHGDAGEAGADDDGLDDDALDDDALNVMLADDDALDVMLADDDRADRGVVLVTRAGAREFAAALSDVRLVVAQRLGLESDDDVEALHDEVLSGAAPHDTGADGPGADPEVRRYWGGIFVAAGFAQESLVSAMLADHRARSH